MTTTPSGSSAPSEFEADTALRPAEGGWVAEVNSRWNIGNNPNGGYLLAIAVRAMLADAGRPDPLTVTAHYLSPPESAPVLVRTGMVKPGRTFVTMTAELIQGGRERVRLLGGFGDLGTMRGPTRVSAAPPSIAAPEECPTLRELTVGAGWVAPAVMQRYEIRLPPDTPWGRARQDDPFEITGWIRFADGTPPSTLSLVTFADAFPPTLIGSIDAGWVPTLELTVHVRRRPAPGWLLGTFRTRFLIDGLMEEDGELWDSEGNLVALSRQLAMVLGPRRADR
ncbi:MAG: thioesterase family protein [Acidimicrobiales bacterium]